MKFTSRLLTIASFICITFVSTKSIGDRFLSAARPNDVTLNYPGVVSSGGTSQIIVIDSGASNSWSGGAI